MAMASQSDTATAADLQQLRHDLLNPLHVMLGTASVLLETELSDFQRTCVKALRSSAQKLVEIADNLQAYHGSPLAEGRARLADLCSIAAARIGKPFDRERLVGTIERVAGKRPLRILLVDDAAEVAVLVRAFLSGTPWELVVVGDGERAMAQATTERFDLVLMDIDLPGIDGATAAHAIRAADLARGAAPTPIVALTAFDPPPIAAAAGEPRRDRSAALAIDADTVAAGGDAGREPRGDADVVRVDDPEIAPLVPEFLANRRAEVRGFRDALAAGEFGRIQSGAHKLKGSGRGYGFVTISRIGGELEIAAQQLDRARVASLVDELESYLTRVKVV
jgi:CheY-like chemotaxis protein